MPPFVNFAGSNNFFKSALLIPVSLCATSIIDLFSSYAFLAIADALK